MLVSDIRLSHAAIIVDEAIECLVGTGTFAERLLAASQNLIGIAPDEFDRYPEVKAVFEQLRQALSRDPDEGNGRFAATIRRAGHARRQAMAKLFIDLDRAIRRADATSV